MMTIPPSVTTTYHLACRSDLITDESLSSDLPKVDRASLFGLFLRKAILTFDQLSFMQVCERDRERERQRDREIESFICFIEHF
jgi:hypothetical protein